MKKILALVLSVAMMVSFTACGGSSGSDASNDESKTPEKVEEKDSKTEEKKSNEDYKGSLTVYSPHDADPLNAAVAMFEKAYPNVKVEVIADGTGNLLNRIAAESAAPSCDVMWGGGADSLAAYKQYFQPYKPSCIDLLDSSLYDPEYYWIGESPLPMVFLVNTDMVAEADIPKTWADLADPKWEGKIAFANPASSGSAFTQLCTILMTYGKEDDEYKAGWDKVNSMIKNLVVQAGSSDAHKKVDSGEYPIGITLEKAAVKYDLSDKGHLKMVYPEDGTSAVPDGVAIIKDCPNLELAQLFEEFALSAECQKAQNVDFGRRPIRSDVTPEGLVELSKIKLMSYNFDYAASKKSDIVSQWQDVVAQ